LLLLLYLNLTYIWLYLKNPKLKFGYNGFETFVFTYRYKWKGYNQFYIHLNNNEYKYLDEYKTGFIIENNKKEIECLTKIVLD